MNSIEKRCEILDQEVDKLKTKILGEYSTYDDEEALDTLIDLAMMLGESCVYRDNVVVEKVGELEVVNDNN